MEVWLECSCTDADSLVEADLGIGPHCSRMIWAEKGAASEQKADTAGGASAWRGPVGTQMLTVHSLVGALAA